MRLLVVLTVLALASLAGCAEDAPDGPSWRISGAFAEDADDADVADLQGRLQTWDTSASILESYPLQYAIVVGTGPACDEVRDMLGQRPYIATVGRCQAIEGA